MHVEDRQLKEFILDSGLVSKNDISIAEKGAKKLGESIGSILVKNGKLTVDDLRKIKAYILGIPFVDLKGQKLDFDILFIIPEPIARNHNIIAFKKKDDSLEVAMLDIEDLTAIDFIKKKVNLKILPRLTDSDSLKSALLQYQKSLKDEFGEIIRKESSSLKSLPNKDKNEKVTEEDLKKLAEDIPVIRIVDTLLKHAIIQNASDIHVEPMESQVLVRYRIDGILRDAMVLPKNVISSITARIKVLANLKLDEKRLPQDGRFRIEIDGEKISFRVSTLPTYFGEKTVMRILRENVSGFTLEILGFHGEALERVHRSFKSTTGMILTTGPTGSGKTTTLYTMLDLLNTTDVNISTIEDPIEYQIKRINQTQIKPEIGLDFASGLRTLVRQDPDVIMVGEIRDSETAGLAVNASLTGHLVLSTLHTNSASGAIPRLLDIGVPPFLLVSTLNIVIGQRLVRKLSEQKEKYFLEEGEIKSLERIIDLDRMLSLLKKENYVDQKADWSTVPFYRPSDLIKGYKGRESIIEVLKISPTIKDIIIKGGISEDIEKQAKDEGMITIIEDGIFKAVSGITSIEEVLRVISE